MQAHISDSETTRQAKPAAETSQKRCREKRQEKLKQQQQQPHCEDGSTSESDAHVHTPPASTSTEPRDVPTTNNPFVQWRIDNANIDDDSNPLGPFMLGLSDSDTARQARFLQFFERTDDTDFIGQGCAYHKPKQTFGGESSKSRSGQRPSTPSESAFSSSTEKADDPIVKDPIDHLGELQREKERFMKKELEKIEEAHRRRREQEEKREGEIKQKEKQSYMEAVREQAAFEEKFENQQEEEMCKEYVRFEKNKEVALRKERGKIMMKHLERRRDVLLECQRSQLMERDKMVAQNLEFVRRDNELQAEIEKAMRRAGVGRRPEELWRAIQAGRILEMRNGVKAPKSKWVKDLEKHQQAEEKRREQRREEEEKERKKQEGERRGGTCSVKEDMADFEQAVEAYREEKRKEKEEEERKKADQLFLKNFEENLEKLFKSKAK